MILVEIFVLISQKILLATKTDKTRQTGIKNNFATINEQRS
jgi:hypothetical protein